MAYNWNVDLPDSIADNIELAPAEDLLLAILRDRHPDIKFFTLIPLDQRGSPMWPEGLEYFILVRRVPGQFSLKYDERFVDTASMSIQVFCKDPDGDQKASLISEGIRVSIMKEARSPKTYPGLGRLMRAVRDEEAVRKTDWATATGPVQFADLPTGYHRYEAHYDCLIRRSLP